MGVKQIWYLVSVTRTVYKSLCYKECYLSNVPVDTLSCAELIRCYTFRGNEKCNVCGHHWQQHLHMMSELEEKMVNVKDEGVEEKLRKNANDISVKETAIQNLQQKIKEANYEHKEIQKAAVRFGLFLKNSITPLQ
jgi:hypothetical protein